MKDNNGLFNLSILEGADDKDIMNMKINESADVSIPVPGGLKEQPDANPVEGVKISIPSGTTITVDQYNSAMSALQKSFKEGVEILDMLKECTVVQNDPEKLQQEFVESAVADAIIEAYENGPYFEAVSREDKNEVKEIVKKIRKNIHKSFEKQRVSFYSVKLVTQMIIAAVGAGGALAIGYGAAGAALAGGAAAVGSALTGAAIGAGTGAAAVSIGKYWNLRLWQVVGVFHIEEGNVKTLLDTLTEEYKDDLGEYKFLSCRAIPGIVDLFRTKFGWKNTQGTYFLLVDKKLPAEMKEIQDEIEKGIKAAEEAKSGEKDK